MTIKLSAAAALTAPAVDDYFWVYDTSAPPNLKKIAHSDMCITGAFPTAPIFSAATTPGTHGYAAQTGYYSRIGDLVFINIYISLNSVGSPVGQLRIANLPYTSSAQYHSLYIGYQSGFTVTSGNQISALVSPSTTHIVLYETDNAGSSALDAPTALSASSLIYISGCYRVA